MSEGLPVALVPPMLGRYELLVPIARGGMGQVWAGRLRGARGFNKVVAIKTLLPQPGAEGRMETMLLEEARIASLIHHANVVQTLELGEHEGVLYLVMEWVDGESLNYLLGRAEQRGQRLPLEVAVNLVGQTLLGLHAAHELTDGSGAHLGVVHRDVSPHNVLVTCDGVAKLVDFGIAKAMNQPSSITEAGEVKGKFSYMAPEVIRCDSVDRRADVFAIGIMLYLLTTGRHPFSSQHPAGILHRIAGAEAAPPASQLVPGYSTALEAVVMKALEKSAELRWQTAEQMLAALQKAVPDAFLPEAGARVREFVSQLIGDHTAQRRDALRNAQLAADARANGTSPNTNMTQPPQSASSLRALSVDTSGEEGMASSRSGLLTMPAPPAGSRRGVLIAALAAATVAAGFTLFRAARSADHGEHLDFGAAGLLETPAREVPRTLDQPAPVSAAGGAPAAAPAVSAEPAATAGSPAPASSRVAPRAARPKTAAPAAPRVRHAHNDDLMAPEYAR